MKSWDKLPDLFSKDIIKPYYDFICGRKSYVFIKRLFDIFASILLIIILFVPSLFVMILIFFSSGWPIIFKQTRVGRYGKSFTIYKFRTMKVNKDSDIKVASNKDIRITSIGRLLRKTHIDEFPQLINVLLGEMSFVGCRPELEYYVDKYKDEWYATLLLRPGITSKASFTYDKEAEVLKEDIEKIYLEVVLPQKMKINLEEIMKLSFSHDLWIMFRTIFRKNNYDKKSLNK